LRKHLERFVTSNLTIVFGAMRDKQLETLGELIFPLAKHLILTHINNARSADLYTLRDIAERHLPGEQISLANSSAEAIESALAKTPSSGLICVTGSLYLIGEVRALLLKPAVA
jgi:dihydrofolate synthase/folylpolyglutamate synthase